MRMKKSFIIIVAMLLILSLFPPSIIAESKEAEQGDIGQYSTKDEVIYGKLSANGNLNNMYVVNSFNITKPGTIIDYGNYTNLRNLTNLSDIEQIGENEINFYADSEEYFYHGELSQPTLPWDVTIRYVLDGEEVQGDELAGQSGALDIQISIKENEVVNPLFFENYLLQVSLTLDPSVFRNIHAPKGTEANEGKNKLVTFTVMPDTEEDLIITADVKKLELDPIQISAIPANIAIDDPDISEMTEDMKKLSDAIHDINSGVKELRDGVKKLTDGTKELKNGSTEYMKGINELNQSTDDLVDGSREICDGLQHVSTALQDNPDMPDLDDMDELMTALNEMAFGLRKIAEELEELKNVYDGAHGALAHVIGEIPDSEFNEEQIGMFVSQVAPD